jgi:hypothetical protein
MTYTPCDYCGDNERGNTYTCDSINGQKIVCMDCLRKLVDIYEKYKLFKSLNFDNMFDDMNKEEENLK